MGVLRRRFARAARRRRAPARQHLCKKTFSRAGVGPVRPRPQRGARGRVAARGRAGPRRRRLRAAGRAGGARQGQGRGGPRDARLPGRLHAHAPEKQRDATDPRAPARWPGRARAAAAAGPRLPDERPARRRPVPAAAQAAQAGHAAERRAAITTKAVDGEPEGPRRPGPAPAARGWRVYSTSERASRRRRRGRGVEWVTCLRRRRRRRKSAAAVLACLSS